jgi:hypothetical protein
MVDPALQRLWLRVRAEFDRARALLPLEPVETEGSIRAYEHYLVHNELELALDELMGLGEANTCPAEYWIALRSAAEQMGLTEHVAQIRSKLTLNS